MATTAKDIILGGLRFINAYSSGEPLDSSDALDALETLNDVTESLSTTRTAIFSTLESTFTFIPGQYIYTVGNYDAGTFAGTVTSGSPTITAASIPSDMVVNGDLSGAGIAAGTTIIAIDTGLGTVTMSANGTSSPGPQQIGYTIPGNFKMARPLRVLNAFTRLTQSLSALDYDIEIVDQSRYLQIGFKGIPAPWPIMLWYNPTYPLGTMFFYQSPSSAGELHLFTTNLLSTFPDLTTAFSMPQGYKLWLKRELGRALAPEYGAIWTPMREKLWKQAKDMVESLNALPAPVAKYDPELYQSAPTDAGWILSGGFR